MSRSTGEDEDEPPALPSEPPPAPNWNTFPSPSGGGPADSFMENSDVLPDTSTTEVKHSNFFLYCVIALTHIINKRAKYISRERREPIILWGLNNNNIFRVN